MIVRPEAELNWTHRLPKEWVQAGTLLGVMLLISAAGLLTVRYMEESNPRRVVIGGAWPLVREHHSTLQALTPLGQPDQDHGVNEIVEGRFTCVRELTWYTWPQEHSGNSYSVCLDAGNVVRRKSEGMAFNLRTW